MGILSFWDIIDTSTVSGWGVAFYGFDSLLFQNKKHPYGVV